MNARPSHYIILLELLRSSVSESCYKAKCVCGGVDRWCVNNLICTFNNIVIVLNIHFKSKLGVLIMITSRLHIRSFPGPEMSIPVIQSDLHSAITLIKKLIYLAADSQFNQ